MGAPSSFLFALGVLIAAPAAAQAAAVDVGAAEFEASLTKLGALPRLEAVEKLVRHPCVARPEWAQPLVEILSLHKSYVSALGLLALAEHSIPTVRAAALQNLTQVGLRVAAADAQPVRAALRDSDDDVRVAAVAALCVVGDDSDVPALLELLAHEDQRLQIAAFRALQSLTGLQLPNDQRQWAYWRTHSSAQLTRRIDLAIQTIDQGGAEADVLDARMLLSSSAWFDARKIEGAVRGWLQSGDPRLRIEGYGLAASARLGSMAEDVTCALRFETDIEILPRAIASAKVLGVATADIVGEGAPGTEQVAQASPAPAGEVAIHTQPATAPTEADPDALIAQLDAADETTRLTAMKGLCLLARPEDGARVFELLKDTKSDAIKKQACLFLGRVQHRAAVRELIDLLRDAKDPGLKAGAHWSLQRITGLKLRRELELWEQWWEFTGEAFVASTPR
ncbi:MAG TPA: HEAT repeat domain-containing protein [Planctomycetota bacterium]|nr:HEAT repeat domain-containing protein [Planctomycetota bacterium]